MSPHRVQTGEGPFQFVLRSLSSVFVLAFLSEIGCSPRRAVHLTKKHTTRRSHQSLNQSMTCGCGNHVCLVVIAAVPPLGLVRESALFTPPRVLPPYSDRRRTVIFLTESQRNRVLRFEAGKAGLCARAYTGCRTVKIHSKPIRCRFFQPICSQRASVSHCLCRSWHSKGTKPARSTVAAPLNSRSKELAMPRRPRDAFPSSLIGGSSPRGVCARNPRCPLVYAPCRAVTGMASPGRRGGSPGRRGGLGCTTHTVSPSPVSTGGLGRGVTVSRQFGGDMPRCARYECGEFTTVSSPCSFVLGDTSTVLFDGAEVAPAERSGCICCCCLVASAWRARAAAGREYATPAGSIPSALRAAPQPSNRSGATGPSASPGAPRVAGLC